VSKGPRAVVVYRDALFRDCLTAILDRDGWRNPLTLELREFKPGSVDKAQAVIVEVVPDDPGWWLAVQPILQHQVVNSRVLVMGMSFADDEVQLFLTQRLPQAASDRLMDILEAWAGDSAS
jgi:hypothetical protein